MKKTLIAICVIFISGCAEMAWVRPNTDQAQSSRDRYECQKQAVAMFPPAIVTRASTPPPEGQMVSGHYVAPNPMQYMVAVMPASYDASRGGRENAFSECMQSQGYEYRQKPR